MVFNEIEIGKIYSSGDDALYKITDKANDWICGLVYSYNHKVCVPFIYGEKDFIYEYWNEETEEYVYDIFANELFFAEDNILKENYE